MKRWIKGILYGILVSIIVYGLLWASVLLPWGDAQFGYQTLLIFPLAPIFIIGGFIIGLILDILKSKKEKNVKKNNFN